MFFSKEEEKMRRILSVILCLCMLCTLAAAAQADALFTAGTYEGEGTGNNTSVPVRVQVVLSQSGIESVTVISHEETEAIAAIPLEQIPADIVRYQSLAVDTVSGATMTSRGSIEAVSDAIAKSGADPQALMTPIEKETVDLGDRTTTTDVLVIGAGGTGLASAMTVLQGGQNVILVEKNARVGGSTAVSGAVVAAEGTYYTDTIGIEPDYDAWLASWKEAADSETVIIGEDPGFPTYDRVSQYFREVATAVNWTEDTGVAHWVSYPFFPNTYYQVPEYLIDKETGAADPEGGYMLTDRMAAWFTENGGDLRLSTRGTKLLTNEAGDVIGAVVEDANGAYEIYAENVVLATGGFAASQEMMDQYLSQFADWLDLTTSGSGSTGDGMRMAVEVGGVMYNDPYVITLGSTSRNSAAVQFVMSINLWYRLVVNSSAERFFNEGYMPYQTTVTLSRIEDGIAWAIGDSQYAGVQELAAGVDGVELVTADTIEGLAEAMGVDAAALKATIDRYNEIPAAGVDEDFGKDAALATAINTAPYYAVRVYVCTGGTIGGVKTNSDYQVIREDGTAIPGLYAGGEVSNREMYAYAYSSGSGVGYALASGHAIGLHILGK